MHHVYQTYYIMLDIHTLTNINVAVVEITGIGVGTQHPSHVRDALRRTNGRSCLKHH